MLNLLLRVPLAGMAKTDGTRKRGDYDVSGIGRPRLLNAQSYPTMRFSDKMAFPLKKEHLN